MIGTIPAQMLKDTVNIQTPETVDAWNIATSDLQTQYHVHLQSTDLFRRTANDMSATYKAVLFIDARLSFPFIDWEVLQNDAEQKGYQLQIEVNHNTYTVVSVNSVHNDIGGLHHYEVGCV